MKQKWYNKSHVYKIVEYISLQNIELVCPGISAG